MFRLQQLISLVLLTLAACPAHALELFVAPDAAPDGDGSRTRPFATPAQARDHLRTLRRQVTLSEPVTVRLFGGVYYLDEPLVFTPDDSGTRTGPIAWKSVAGERAILSGGRPITGWRQQGGVWITQLEKDLTFTQLFVNGRRATLARHPNSGFLRTDGPMVPAIKRWHETPNRDLRRKLSGGSGFRYAPGDIRRWDNLDDIIVNAMHQWNHTRHWIREVDETSRVVRFTNDFLWDFGYWETKQRYWLENAREFLDAPGEWHYDRRTGQLAYKPLPGESLGECEFIRPALPRIISVEGRPEDGRFVEYLTFEGLTLHHTLCDTKKWDATVYAQANAMLKNAAVYAIGLRHGQLLNIEIAHTGEHGLWLNRGCTDNLVQQCELRDLGAGGVYIGEGGWNRRCYVPKNPADLVARNTIDNCFVHDATNIFHGSVGVWIGCGSYNTVSHNEICDMDYMGVNVGWCWGYKDSSAHHNVVESNHIHHLPRRRLTDTAAVYTLGVSPGTVIRGNRIHDIYGYPHHAHTNGIYNDEGSGSILWENNLVYNVGSAGYNLNHGRELTVRNNIFAFYDDYAFNLGALAEGQDVNAVTLESNIFYGRVAELTAQRKSGDNFSLRSNIYWNTEGPVTLRGGEIDSTSVVADPRFAAPEKGDFALRADSPAVDIGFQPFDVSHAGLYGDSQWIARARSIERSPAPVPDPPQYKSALDDDFESYPAAPDAEYPGFPLHWQVDIAGRASMVVTAETAASGRKSLCITDAPGIVNYLPYMHYSLDGLTGSLRFICDLRNDPDQPAHLVLEFRDYETKDGRYQTGPKLEMKPDGSLQFHGRNLAHIAPGTWFRLTMDFAPGRDNTADIRIQSRDADPIVVQGLGYDKKFNQLDWVGLLSISTDTARCCVDNIQLIQNQQQ